MSLWPSCLTNLPNPHCCGKLQPSLNSKTFKLGILRVRGTQEGCSWNSLSYHDPHHPEAAGLTEWPSEDLVTMSAKWQYFVGAGQVSPRGYVLNQRPI